MATNPNMSMTLLDASRRADPDGSVAPIIELLNESNAIVNDMLVMECNSGVNHVTTIRNGLPDPIWRKYNTGVPNDKSTTTQITDHTGMMESRSLIDKKLVQINAGQDNGASYRTSENVAFIEAMGQEVAEQIFYGSVLDSEKFIGLTERYNALSTNVLDSGYNIIDGGGTGSDNMSMWLVGWGDRAVHCLYPKGSNAGFNYEDLGEQQVADANGYRFTALEGKYTWDIGLSVRDWKQVVRIANIDTSLLEAGTGADLITLMIKALAKLPVLRAGNQYRFYARQEIMTALEIQMLSKTNAALTWGELQGQEVMKFRNIPIGRCDQLLTTEARVK